MQNVGIWAVTGQAALFVFFKKASEVKFNPGTKISMMTYVATDCIVLF